MGDKIKYHFPQQGISKTRVVFYSFGLYCSTITRLLIGSLVTLLCFAARDYFIVSANKQSEELIVFYQIITFSIIFYSWVYFIWKIKWVADGNSSSRFEFIRLFVRYYVPIIMISCFFSMFFILNLRLLLFPFVYFYPALIFVFPLLLINKNSTAKSLLQSFKLAIGNWIYVTFCFGIVFGCFYFILLVFKLNFIHFINSGIGQVIFCFVFLPYLAAFTLILLNSVLFFKTQEGLRHIEKLRPLNIFSYFKS